MLIGLACCACLIAAIVYMRFTDDIEDSSLESLTQQESSDMAQPSGELFPTREDISYVTVQSGGESFTVVAGANGAQPHIKELEGIRQNYQLQSSLLSLCASVKGEKLVEQSAVDMDKYGLEVPSGIVRISYADGTSTAIIVGDPSPVDKRQVYAAVEGEKKVWIIADSAAVFFTGNVRDYVSQTILPAAENSEAQTAKMTILKSGSPDITLEKNAGAWTMTSPIKAALSAENSAGTVNGLYGLSAEYCEQIRPDEAALKRCGLDKPTVTVGLSQSGLDVTLKIGSAVEKKDSSDKDRYYCSFLGAADTDCIYVVAKEYLPWIDVTAQDLISKTMLPNYLVNLKAVNITVDGKSTEYEIINVGGDDKIINMDVSRITTTAVRSSGREIAVTDFKQFYEFLMGCPTSRIFTDDDNNEAYATIVYKKNDGTADRLELVKMQNGYGARVNGQMSYLISSAWVDTLIVNIQALAQGKTITAQG